MRSISDSYSYFASANSFEGFKSNFAKIFAPEEYERIYIIKGGPGTGKSSLMKRISENLRCKDVTLTKFLCSSDPKSLDAIILSRSNKKIAFIDGTAPHTTEAKYIGAVERIINLADSLDISKLKTRKEEIISISKSKSMAYKNAYLYLNTCEKVHDYIMSELSNIDINSEAEEICDRILTFEMLDKINEKTEVDCWVSAFCKDGYVRLNIPCVEKEYISIKGDGFTEQVIMKKLRDTLSSYSCIQRIATSPLTSNAIDLIITNSAIISTDNVGSTVIDTSMLARHMDKEYKEPLDIYRRMLKLSQDCFMKASKFHFELEEIYSSNIDFALHDLLINDLTEEIGNLLL